MEIGKLLQQVRLSKNITISKAAKHLKVSTPHFCDLEYNRRQLKQETINELLKLYKLTEKEKLLFDELNNGIESTGGKI